ncbi:MAG TPA: hypothetical protein VGD54_10850 [Steroidobacteraceae bacterium]
MRRREFLSTGAACAALAAAGPGNAAAVSQADRPEGFSRAQFRAWLNQEFNLVQAGSLRQSRATLIAVDDAIPHAKLDEFSVLFRGGAAMPGGLCWLSPPNGPQFLLHLHGAPEGSLRRAHFSLLETLYV